MIALFLTLLSLAICCTNLGYSDQCSDNGICAFDPKLNATRCVCTMPFVGSFCNMTALTTTAATTASVFPTATTTTAAATTTVAETTALPTTTTAAATTTTTTAAANSSTSTSGSSGTPSSDAFCYGRSVKACSGHGTCEKGFNGTYYCECDNAFMGQQCEIQQKKKWIAWALSFFLGEFGAGRFYLDYIGLGVLKLIIGLIGCYGFCVCACLGFTQLEKHEGPALAFFACGICIVITLFATDLIWWLVDWIMILADALPDAAGNPLAG